MSLWTSLVENFKVKEGFDRIIVNGTLNACGDNHRGYITMFCGTDNIFENIPHNHTESEEYFA